MNAPTARTELPDPFLRPDGTRLRVVADWPAQRARLLEALLEMAYGVLPPPPARTLAGELHRHSVPRLDDALHVQYRLQTEPDPAVSFILDLLVPPGPGPYPVILNGDGCWRYVTDTISLDVLRRGYILAQFNRLELATDTGRTDHTNGLPAAAPGDYGALAAWAWGYHRCVDALLTLPWVDGSRLAIVGHSRGGKTTLLAGATDTRIALTAANNSGCGGAGCLRLPAEGAETLEATLRVFPYWFTSGLRAYARQPELLPFDLHTLKALIAPRALLTTEALGDLWANPSGTWLTHTAAREVYGFLGAEAAAGIWYREGGHAHTQADWAALLDFADWQFFAKPGPRRFDASPFRTLPPAHSWCRP